MIVRRKVLRNFVVKPRWLGKFFGLTLFHVSSQRYRGRLDAVDSPTPGDAISTGVAPVPVGGDLARGAIKNGGRTGDFTRTQKNAANAENATQDGGKMAVDSTASLWWYAPDATRICINDRPKNCIDVCTGCRRWLASRCERMHDMYRLRAWILNRSAATFYKGLVGR